MNLLKRTALTLTALMLLTHTAVAAITLYEKATEHVYKGDDGYVPLKQYLMAGDYRLTSKMAHSAYGECLVHGRQWVVFDDTERFCPEKGFKLLFPYYKYRIIGHEPIVLAGGGGVANMGFFGRLYLDRIGDYKGSMAGAPGFFGKKVDIIGHNDAFNEWSSFTLIDYDDNDNITEIVSAHKECCHKKTTIGGISIGTSAAKLRSLYGEPATKEENFPFVNRSIWKYPMQGWEFQMVDNLVYEIKIYPDSDRRFDDTGLGPKSYDVDFMAHFGKVSQFPRYRSYHLKDRTSIWFEDDGSMIFSLTPMS